MTAKIMLETYYKGDEAWQVFVSAFEEHWEKCYFKEELIGALNGQEDIALVVYASVKDRWKSWIDQPIPALDGLSPHDCVKNQILLRRLRTMLMRMPR